MQIHVLRGDDARQINTIVEGDNREKRYKPKTQDIDEGGHETQLQVQGRRGWLYQNIKLMAWSWGLTMPRYENTMSQRVKVLSTAGRFMSIRTDLNLISE